jgi:hyperosmotically inducible protein
MKFLALIPALCLVCFGCSNTSSSNKSSSQEASSDWEITTKVKASILSDSSVSGSARFVSVTTNNGVVTLTGNVPSQADANRIVKITKNVDGVQSVDNQLTVSG